MGAFVFLGRRSLAALAGAAILVLCRGGEATGGEYYRWTDKDGTVSFSDHTGNIPSNYKGTVEAHGTPAHKEAARPAGNVPDRGYRPPATQRPVEPPPDRVEPEPSWEIPYTPVGAGGEQRIIIPVTLNGKVTAKMAVDTGAPGMVLSMDLAKRLGVLDERTAVLTTAGGIGGTTPAFRTIIDTVSVDGAEDRFVPTTVLTSSLSPSFEGLVGMDFMSRYSMRIDPVRTVVILTPIVPEGKAPGGHDERWWRSTFREFSGLKTSWAGYVEKLDELERSGGVRKNRLARLREMKDMAVRQKDEADRLYNELLWYATDSGVPMDWRNE